jgi:hypothetical protein
LGDDDDPAGTGLPAETLFVIVWNALADTLGTAATAAIVRRAAGRAAVDHPDLVDLVILREELAYRYRLPAVWSQTEKCALAFRALVAEIGRLLMELTGTVVIGRLEQIPELRACRLVWRGEKTR